MGLLKDIIGFRGVEATDHLLTFGAEVSLNCAKQPVFFSVPKGNFELVIGFARQLGLNELDNDTIAILQALPGRQLYHLLNPYQTMKIGREFPNTFEYPMTVSRRHATIARDHGTKITISDLNSTYGIVARGRKPDSKQRLF